MLNFVDNYPTFDYNFVQTWYYAIPFAADKALKFSN